MTSRSLAFRAARLTAIAAALFALTACAGTATPAPSATTLPPATPSASAPAPEDDTEAAPVAPPAEIILSADGFSIVGDDGVPQFEYLWPDEGELAIAALEDVFGTPAVTSTREGDGTHYPDYAVYTWDGLSFFDESTLEKPRDEYPQPSYVEFTADQARGIVLRSVDGIRVGDSAESVRALGPATSWYIEGSGGIYLFDVEDPGAAMAGNPAGATVTAESDAADQTIVVLRAWFDSGL